MAKSQSDNTSGQGSLAIIPQEIRGWNWGAFLLTFIWGISHGVWISLIGFLPFLNIIMYFVLGVKGNEWAWRNQRWDSIEHFKRTQRKWAWWGLVVWVVSFIIGMLLGLAEALPSYGQESAPAHGQESTPITLKTYTNMIHGYSIKYPSSWKLDESGETVQIGRPLREYISIGVLEEKGKWITTEDFEGLIEHSIKVMETKFDNFQLVSKARLYNIGREAWETVETIKAKEDLVFTAKTRFIAYKDRLFIITVWAPGFELPSALETALKSFYFLE